MKYEDTLKNRMKAIESCVAMDGAFDIDCIVYRNKFLLQEPKEKLIELLKSADKIITDVYKLSHGYNSKCCKGNGAKLIEPRIKQYFD